MSAALRWFGDPKATNARRVGIYLAEKGLQLPRIDVNMAAGEHRGAAFLAKNPAGKVPVLELDDGRYLTESAAIVEYLEERFPDRPMLGTTPEQRAHVRSLERIVGELILRGSFWLMHGHPFFAARVPKQEPIVAQVVKATIDEQLTVLEHYIGAQPFLAGDRPMIPDCSLFAFYQTCRQRLEGVEIGAHCPRLDAWYGRFAQRPSARYT